MKRPTNVFGDPLFVPDVKFTGFITPDEYGDQSRATLVLSEILSTVIGASLQYSISNGFSVENVAFRRTFANRICNKKSVFHLNDSSTTEEAMRNTNLDDVLVHVHVIKRWTDERNIDLCCEKSFKLNHHCFLVSKSCGREEEISFVNRQTPMVHRATPSSDAYIATWNLLRFFFDQSVDLFESK